MRRPTKAASKLRLALDRLICAFPLFGNIIAQGVFEAARIATMAVTLRARQLVFMYSDAFVRAHSLDELTAVLEHEALHVVLKHLEADRAAYPNVGARTIAEEVTVNELVTGTLPGNPLTISRFGLPPGESTHERYVRLVKHPKTVPGHRKSVRKAGKSVRGGKKAGHPRPLSGQGAGIPTIDDHSQWPATMDATDREVLERVIGQATRQTSIESIEAMPGAVRQAIRGLIPDDRSTELTIGVCGSGSAGLVARLRQIAKRTPTWKRKNRRQPESALPGSALQRLRVLCAIDTSGSMDADSLSSVNGALRAVAADHDVWIVECDYQIRATYRYRGPLRSVRGRGSTDLRPPFAVSVLASIRPDVMIYATDGGGEAPATAPRMPVFWALTRDGAPPTEWGHAIYLCRK
jgi:predicted metal-dependent peptidase